MRTPSYFAAFAAGLASLAGTALADAPGQGPGEGGVWHHGMWHDGWGGMLFGPMMMLVFLVVIVLVAVLAVRTFGAAGPSRRSSSDKAALDILKERFARGEIEQDEFERRRQVLGQ